ncbi:MAG: hypothetical protein AB1641_04450 [Thermodesulfobacteriota bacterium]
MDLTMKTGLARFGAEETPAADFSPHGRPPAAADLVCPGPGPDRSFHADAAWWWRRPWTVAPPG